MSLIGTIAGTASPKPSANGPNPSSGEGGQGSGGAPRSSSEPDSSGSAAPKGTAAPAETTQTSSQLPPVTASRSANASSDARPGADGSRAETRGQLDFAFTRDLDPAQARREAEAARQDLIQKEILSKIGMPDEARPNLNESVEEIRSIEPGPTATERSAA